MSDYFKKMPEGKLRHFLSLLCGKRDFRLRIVLPDGSCIKDRRGVIEFHRVSNLLFKGGRQMANAGQPGSMGPRSDERIPESELVDIRHVKVDTDLPASLRMQKYLEQIKNPYCFLCGDTPVKITFSDTNTELPDLLRKYFITLK